MALPEELLSLADELASLGGGDARVGQASVLCRVRPAAPGNFTVVETEPLGSEMSTVCVRSMYDCRLAMSERSSTSDDMTRVRKQGVSG